MEAVAVRSIAEDVANWITSGGKPRASLQPLSLMRSSSKSLDAFVSYASPASSDFARAVLTRLRLERPTLKVSMEGEDERKERNLRIAKQSGPAVSTSCSTAKAILVCLTADTFTCPLVCQEIATALQVDNVGNKGQRLAFVYHVRSGKGQNPIKYVANAPLWLQREFEGVRAQKQSLRVSDSIPIFEYLHEYDDLCASSLLHWLDGLQGVSAWPSSTTLARLHSGLRSAANLLRPPAHSQLSNSGAPAESAKVLPPLQGASPQTPGKSEAFNLAFTASAVKSSSRNLRPVALGLLHSACERGASIAEEVSEACGRAFGSGVRTEILNGGKKGTQVESVANLMVIITPGAFGPGEVVQQVLRALRCGPLNILLLQDICSVPDIWHEFEKLPAEVRPAVAPIIALPYLKSYGFSACLARMAGSDLLRPVNSDKVCKPITVQYGRAPTAKLFDLFFCHFQRTGLDWAFVMRLSFQQHAGPSFRTLLDVQSIQNLGESGRFVEQSHGLAVLVTPGIFTRYFCQRELMLARKSGVQVIFIQHMRSCVNIEEEVKRISGDPSEFMALYGYEYSRSGGTEADVQKFQHIFFQEIWTPRFRPAVFAYVHELEAACVKEVVAYLRHRRRRGARGAEQLDEAARAMMDFLRMSPEDEQEVRAGMGAVANMAAGGAGEEFCAALVNTKAMPTIASALERHSADSKVAHQSLRALRTISCTHAGSAALHQFATSEGALPALCHTLQKYSAEASSEEEDSDYMEVRQECLEVLRAFHHGSPALQLALHQAKLAPEFETLFRRLRSELEPLDEIRETLDLAPVRLPELEIALEGWHKACAAGRQEADPQQLVERASSLLAAVRELQEAVAAEDGQRAEALLQKTSEEVARCAGLQDLLQEAKKQAFKFREQRRLLEEQCLLREEHDQLQRDTEALLLELCEAMSTATSFDMVGDLENAIVAAHQTGCTIGSLELAEKILKEVRTAFGSPLVFLGKPLKTCKHVEPRAMARALLQVHRVPSDRSLAISCLHCLMELTKDETTCQRSEAEQVVLTMNAFQDDLDVQAAACNCLCQLLHVTRFSSDVVSARALVEHPSTGHIKAAEHVLAALSLATHWYATRMSESVPCLIAALRCLLEIAKLGEGAIADIMSGNGRSRTWRVVKTLGEEGRTDHEEVVDTAVSVLEEMVRQGRSDSSALSQESLLNLCSFYGQEISVCTSALQALCTLFRERPLRASVLLAPPEGHEDMEPRSPKSPGQMSRTPSCGLAIVLRAARVHSHSPNLQQHAFRIVEMSLHGAMCKRGEVDEEYIHDAVCFAILALTMHLSHVPACVSASSCLAAAVDLSAQLACNEIVKEDGVKAIVGAMRHHPEAQELLQCNLKVLSIITQLFPNQTLGESSIYAIVTAMKTGLADCLTQLFGCAALRSLAQRSSEVAEEVGQHALESLFSAMEAFPANLAVQSEALHTIWLVASVSPELARALGERSKAVPRILEALRELQKVAAAFLSDRSRHLSLHSQTEREKPTNCLLMACRALRAFCEGRAACGASYDMLFHRGLCKASPILARLLGGTVPAAEAHALEIEVLKLLDCAAASDMDGALTVGPVLSQPPDSALNESMSASGSNSPTGCKMKDAPFNLVVDALHRFHTDSDCVVLFRLTARLAASDDFAASTSEPVCVNEIMRLAAFHPSDAAVQLEATKCLAALLSSPAFDAGLLVNTNAVESLLLAASRHTGSPSLVAAVHSCFLDLAKRSKPRRFYIAFEAALKRQESNAGVLGAASQALCVIFEGEAEDCESLLESGTVTQLMAGFQRHRKTEHVRQVMPELCDFLTLRARPAMHNLLLHRETHQLLVSVAEGYLYGNPALQSRQTRPEHQKEEQACVSAWLYDITAASRRIELAMGNLERPSTIGAIFRTLRRLYRSAKTWAEIATPNLVVFLMRAMAVSHGSLGEPLGEPAAALLADVLTHAEAHVTWSACGGGPEVSRRAFTLQWLAGDARQAFDNEILAFQQWRAGNFYPAARAFIAASDGYASLKARLPAEQCLRLVLEDHMRDVPLRSYAKSCTEHGRIIAEATASARTSEEIRLTDKSDDCPICLEALGPQECQLWKCEKCRNVAHVKCIHRWSQNQSSCPFCRHSMSASLASTTNGAYFRAYSIAQAAEAKLQDCKIDRKEFLISAVAHLWKSAARVGRALGVDETTLHSIYRRAENLELRSQQCSDGITATEVFNHEFVQEIQALAAREQDDSGNLGSACALIQAVATETCQRRCAVLAKQVVALRADVSKFMEQGRWKNAEEVLVLMGGKLSQILALAPQANFNPAETNKQVEVVTQLREQVHAKISRSSDQSQPFCELTLVPTEVILPFGTCLDKFRKHREPALHSLAALRAMIATARATQSIAEGTGREAETAKRATGAAKQLITVFLEDGFAPKVGACLTGDSGQSAAFLAASIFQELLSCGIEAKNVCFSQLDRIVVSAATVQSRSGGSELLACLCGLVHNIIFSGGLEDRMVRRLQREAAPRMAAALEEWFLDTVLVQNCAVELREDILQPRPVADVLPYGLDGAALSA